MPLNRSSNRNFCKKDIIAKKYIMIFVCFRYMMDVKKVHFCLNSRKTFSTKIKGFVG